MREGKVVGPEQKGLRLTGYRLVEAAASLEGRAVGVRQSWPLPPGILAAGGATPGAGTILGFHANGAYDPQLVGMPVDAYQLTVQGGGLFGRDPVVTLMGQPRLQKSSTGHGHRGPHRALPRRSPVTRATATATAETRIAAAGSPYSSQGFSIAVPQLAGGRAHHLGSRSRCHRAASHTLYAKRAAHADRPGQRSEAPAGSPLRRDREGGIG